MDDKPPGIPMFVPVTGGIYVTGTEDIERAKELIAQYRQWMRGNGDYPETIGDENVWLDIDIDEVASNEQP